MPHFSNQITLSNHPSAHSLYHHDWRKDPRLETRTGERINALNRVLPRLQVVSFTPKELGFDSLESAEHAIQESGDPVQLTNFVDHAAGVIRQFPFIESDAFVDSTADLLGSVYICKGGFIAPDASIRMDEHLSIHPLMIGKDTNIQDHVTVHAQPDRIGERVIVAHDAVVHGCTLEDDVTIYIKAIIDTGSYVEKGCFIDAAAYIGRGVRVPANRYVAPMQRVLNKAEAEALPLVNEEQKAMRQHVLDHNAIHSRKYLKTQEAEIAAILDA